MAQAAQRIVRLEPHATARSKAVAAASLSPGALIVSDLALSSALLPSEKGRRCDACHILASAQVKLRKCTGCASYWYCGQECQTKQWKAHHRKICKSYHRYTTSTEYQSLSRHDQVDTILLSQLVAEAFPDDTATTANTREGSFSTFMELMEGPSMIPSLPLCRSKPMPDTLQNMAPSLYRRFGNNNFMVHSHLNSHAHGIFPLASRLFNHSCVPNAVTKYIITPSHSVRMEVIALRIIQEGEEITIPYLDPALPVQTRREGLYHNYGFICHCELCSFASQINPTIPPAQGSVELAILEEKLRVFAAGDLDSVAYLSPQGPVFLTMPEELAPFLHESYLPNISELFSKTSHEGNYREALSIGLTLLALYKLLYPLNYPQIGMHALELAKTAWNAAVTDASASAPSSLENEMRSYLGMASRILEIFGSEGDEGGPLEEIRVLKELSGST